LKQADYIVLHPLGRLIQMTEEFWRIENTNATISEMRVAPDASSGTMSIEQATTFTSWGQNYRMDFARIDENSTSVTVSVNLVYGGGPQWSKPNTILKKWAEFVGTSPVKLA
jgi:hypothetical protein